MLIIYDEQNKQLKVVRNNEYRKWLLHIERLNKIATASGVNPFEQDPVKWETVKFDGVLTEKQLDVFKNTINGFLNSTPNN